MDSYKKEFTFKIVDKNTIEKKLHHYLNLYGFKTLESNENQ